MVNELECIEGEVDEVIESKKKTGHNLKVGSKWVFVHAGMDQVKPGDRVKVEAESSVRDDGGLAFFAKTLKVLEAQAPAPCDFPDDVDLLKSILVELRLLNASVDKLVKSTV